MKYVLPLTEKEKETLKQMYKNHRSSKVRMRAQSILLSDKEFSIQTMSQIYEHNRQTISSWLDRWEEQGLAGLYDKPGNGRHRIFTEIEEEKVCQYLQSYPREIKKVIHTMEKDTGKKASAKTIKRIVKNCYYSWKRIKKVPSKSPDPIVYQRFKKKLESWQLKALAQEIDLRYFDITGFSLQSYVPYAWQLIGKNIELPTSKSKRLNLLGFLNRSNDLTPFLFEGTVDTSVVVACFNAFCQKITKKTVVLIDNAPIHTSKEFIRNIRSWVKRGLIIKYLPVYSPQLNLIEILWRFIKYKWLPFSAYESFKSLVSAVENIVSIFGKDQKFSVSFQTV